MSAIPEQERARDPLAVVRAYAAAGFRVLPIHTAPDGRCSCGKADCHSPGKHPRTEHGVATGWARTLRGTYGIDALAVAVGDDGHAAEVMATTADWETKSVRRQLLALAASATHVLIDDPTAPAADALAAACPGRVVVAEAGLPAAVVTGEPPDRADTPMQVLVLGGGVEHVPSTWRVTHLADVPPSLWVAAARHADLLVDHRDPPRLDVVVVNGMAHGAVWVAEGSPETRFRKRVPRLGSVTDPLHAGEAAMRRLRADSAEYARRRHSDDDVAAKLRKALGIR